MRIDKIASECSGCGACATKCPKKAITMQPDNLGFLYPIIDDKRCIDCGLCVKVCGFNLVKDRKNEPLKVYAGRLIANEQLAKSQSGGAFWALATSIIQSNGIVYGAALMENFSVAHIRTDSLNSLERLRGSKYIQSKCNNIYSDVATDLKQGKEVLFSGTPCQVSGLLHYLGSKVYDNLYTVDLVCHGVPSPTIWQDYLRWIENKENDKITNCIFRDKSFGWGSHIETFYFKNRKKISNSVFKELFYRHLIIRESCHNCQFTNLHRVSDITIGDYWGWNNISDRFCDKKGVSLFLINTYKGQRLLENSNHSLQLEPSNTHDCLQPQLKHPASRPKEKDRFIRDYTAKGFDCVIHKYAIIGFRKGIRDFVENIGVLFQKINFHLKRLIKK